MSNIKERIGIVGRGIVGQALANGFEEHEIHIYDKYQDSETLANVCKNSEFIFIALPTPMKGDKIDLSIIDENIEQIVKITDNTTKIVVIKSTVVPGTTANYEKRYPNTLFAFNPEFLKEATFTEDFLNPDRTVIGASNAQVALRVLNLYTKRFPKTKIFRTDPTTAEMVKYMANSLFATLVIYNNIAYDLCQALDISYDEVTSMVKEDSRLHSLKNYFQVTSARGFGGKCLDGKELVYRVEDTKIVPMKIRDFVDAYTGNEYILSHDFLNSKYFVADRVTGVARREVDKVARVLFDDGTEIKTSVDHLFTLKNKKIIEVSKLNVGDEVRCFKKGKFLEGTTPKVIKRRYICNSCKKHFYLLERTAKKQQDILRGYYCRSCHMKAYLNTGESRSKHSVGLKKMYKRRGKKLSLQKSVSMKGKNLGNKNGMTKLNNRYKSAITRKKRFKENPGLEVKWKNALRNSRLKQVFPKKDSSIEKILQRGLRKLKIKFKKHLPIKNICQPDIFIAPNICVFADGDYWHCNPKKYLNGALNATQTFNLARDRTQNKKLKKESYKVLRFWESDIKKKPNTCLKKIQNAALQEVR